MKKLIMAVAFALASGAAYAAAPDFSEVDVNADGRISAEEAEAVSGLDFDAADLDGDGSLSGDEYNKATEAL